MKPMGTVIRLILTVGAVFVVLTVQSQDLEQLIQEAITNSPEIKRLGFEYQIASEKINEAGSLPNTEFNLGVMAISPEMDMPMERFRVSAMQMIPWFGSLSARKSYEAALADAQWTELDIAKRQLALSVAQFYYELYEIRGKQQVLDENLALLQSYELLALNALEVGKASAVDVLRLQMRQNELIQEKELLNQQYQGTQSALNSLMNRLHETKVEVVAVLEMPNEDQPLDFESLTLNPELLKYDKLYDSVEQFEQWNQKEGKPMLGFGVEYINQENHSMITSSYKDMVMPMVSVSIPIFNKKYSSQTKQNQLRKQEIQSQKEDRLNRLVSELSKAVAGRNQSRITFNTQIKNLKQAKDAEDILIKNYETGTIDFKDVLDIQELRLKLQIGQVESVKAYYVQTAIINYLTQ